MRIGMQCNEMGQRGGISTYSMRLCRYLNQLDNVDAKIFFSKYKNKDGKADVLSIQYEPGMLRPQQLQQMIHKFPEPIVVTAHHIGGLQQFYPILDGIVLHDKNQIVGEEPWNFTTIPHPALVYPEKDKIELRKKYNLPEDKKIIGTMGFICGTGKILPLTVQLLLRELKDNEFLYLITSFWKGGDMGRLTEIMKVVEESGKKDNFRIDTDFIVDDEILNEKMQCCDLLYAWNNITNAQPGSQSGSAADMYGARVKLIVKDCPHYAYIGKQDKVLVGRENAGDFVDDVIEALRTENFDDCQNPSHLSWEVMINSYLDYFKEVSE